MIILTNKNSIASARMLRDKIFELSNIYLHVSTKCRNSNIFLRYGNSSPCRREDWAINRPEFIKICANKDRFAKHLISFGINSVVFHATDKNLTFPLIIRTTLTGYGGKGIILCNNMEDFYDNWDIGYFWTPVIEKKREFRVHIIGGNIVKIMEKVPKSTYDIVLNSKTANFRRKDIKYFKWMEGVVDKLNTAFGKKSFYAIDIAETHNDYVIFEANSAPGLNNYTAKIYAEHILKLLGVP